MSNPIPELKLLIELSENIDELRSALIKVVTALTTRHTMTGSEVLEIIHNELGEEK